MIYLIRHGLDNEEFIGGWSDIDLVAEGVKQIKLASDFIVDKRLVINSIQSSDIKRAISTSTILNDRLGVDVVFTKDLRELDKGIYTGVLKKTLSNEEINNINDYTINDKYPNGESMIDLYERMMIYLYRLRRYDNTLLVTHRGVINMFYYLLNDIQLDMDKEKFSVTHGSIHEMDIEKKLIRRIY